MITIRQQDWLGAAVVVLALGLAGCGGKSSEQQLFDQQFNRLDAEEKGIACVFPSGAEEFKPGEEVGGVVGWHLAILIAAEANLDISPDEALAFLESACADAGIAQ